MTVAHYPPGASKWNPIEHRLFSEISKNWAGEPLRNFRTALHFIRTTKTDSGLRVEARYIRQKYETGEKVPPGRDGRTLSHRPRYPPGVELHLGPRLIEKM